MTTIVEIPSCSAAQLVETAAFPLGDGTLQVVISADTVTLRLAELAFPLSPHSPVLTHSQNPLWYFFKGPVEGSYVRITLPEQSALEGTPEHELRDRFEDALIHAGLLTTGVEAAGDEISASVKEDATWVSKWITSRGQAYAGSHDATSHPLTFPAAIHSVATSASSGSLAVAGYAASGAQAIGKGVIGVGSRFMSLFTGGHDVAGAQTPNPAGKLQDDLAEAGYSDVPLDPENPRAAQTPSPHPLDLKPLVDDAKTAAAQASEAMAPVISATKSVIGSISAGTAQVKSAAATGVHNAINYDCGAGAADLTDKAGQAATNVGRVAQSAVDVTPVGLAKRAATGDGFADPVVEKVAKEKSKSTSESAA
ncbi:hypothetical protein FRB95_011429 [Tulasnella sp. JGI-2019a]|nr:hypothetical protein FRB95_011429 [Tulasnella sp. JGI-2019a]